LRPTGGARCERALDALAESPVHRDPPLSAVLADDLVTGLERRTLAGDVGLRATDSFAI